MNEITKRKTDLIELAEMIEDYYQDCFVNMTTCAKLEKIRELAVKVLNNKGEMK